MRRLAKPRSLEEGCWLVVVAVTLLAIIGLHVSRELARSAAPASKIYSRHFTLGAQGVNNAPDLAVVGGGDVLVAWPEPDALAVARVGADGVVRGTGRTGLQGVVARDVRLASGLVSWRDERDGDLFVAPLSAPDLGLVTPERVMDGVTEYAMIDPGPRDQAGASYLLAANPEGVEFWSLGTTGRALGRRELTAPPVAGVVSLDAVASRNGAIHAAFLVRDDNYHFSIRYSVYREGAGWSAPATAAVVSTLGRRASLSGVKLGIDESHAYFFFGRESWRPHETTVHYIAQPLAGPIAVAEPAQLLPSAFRGVDMLADASPNRVQNRELLVGMVGVVTRSKTTIGTEVVEARFRDGRLAGGELATRTKGAALQPRTVGSPGGVFASFLETDGFGRYLVQLTADTPGFRERFNRITPLDLFGALSNAVLSLFSVFGLLVYFAATWIPAFIWLTLSGFVAMTWSERNPRALLWIGMGIYALGKVWMVLSSFYTTAFRLAMPAWLGRPAIGLAGCLVFVGIAAVGVVLQRRSGRLSSPFGAVAFGAIVDTVLTLFLYAPFLR